MKKIYLLLSFFIFYFSEAQNSAQLDVSFNHGYLNGVTASNVKVAIGLNDKIYAIGINSSENPVIDKIVRFNNSGSIDTTFDKGSGFLSYDTTMGAIAIQNDGKIIVGGAFVSYNNTSVNDLVRINPDGSIDNSFNVGLGAGNGFYNPAGVIWSLKIQEDGKILCAGDFRLFNGTMVNNIVRLNPDGSLDTSFYTGAANSPLFCVEVDPVLNKIYIAGSIIISPFKGISRLNLDGQIDNTFDINGHGFNGDVRDLAIQIDGKIIAVGNFTAITNDYTTSDRAFRIAKLNVDGSRDISFNAKFNENIAINGSLPVSNLQPTLSKVLIKNDGKILVCGAFNRYNNSYNNMNVAQLNNDGSTDINFNSYSNYGNSYLTDLALQNDNKIIVAGDFSGFNGDFNYSHVNRLLGKDYYLFKGLSIYDGDLNGCSMSDNRFNFLRFNVASTNPSTSWYSSFHGNNSILFKNGSYTITPVLENSSYFNISPNSVNVNFPSNPNPFIQDFCITPNGNHPDLEISILPLTPARPGFYVVYKLFYKNKGNQLQSGSISLIFDDDVLDLVSSVPSQNTISGNSLSWNYTDLVPMESREITIVFNTNTPIDNPSLNGGDVLSFTANIVSPLVDETPIDNTFNLNQTVVNSYDPNDKTCLQGETVLPDIIGNYVHYLIRFENTGNYYAQNITVIDYIDISKFDISTLVPLSGSHSFITKISEGNKVEFYFENINLPFEDAYNDGYVVFKIKTKSNLNIGDSFSNSANIYFDYNYPIITNEYVSTIQALSSEDFNFKNYFTVYPNPVDNILNISRNNNVLINNIAIYNVLGQLVISIPNAESVQNIDVSKLSEGHYFIVVKTEKGISNTKFIKN